MKKVYIAFLWHHHQPMYRQTPPNVNPPVYSLPWVRLHAIKDYYDTLSIIDDFPKIKLNFNFVPSLLVQLEEYANKNATDKFLELTLKQANKFTKDDKIFVLKNFFMANWNTMIFPYKRYSELLLKRGQFITDQEISRIETYFKPQDILDLQVWFNLTWFDPYWRKTDEFIKKMFDKGENFTEEEKNIIIQKQRQICGKIFQKYLQMQQEKRIEISVSPFYHPILPLIYNTDIAKKAMPDVILPQKFSHPEDVREQIYNAVSYYEKIFQTKPRGMWPSEGSVCEEIIPIIQSSGINWIATDEEILFNTLNMHRHPNISHPRFILYQPFRLEIENKYINIIFRDRILSDSIGFVYSNWDADAAVDDFVNKKIGYILKTIENNHCFVPVILDGENCWEFYPEDGTIFLKKLYSKISEHPQLETVTISEYLQKYPPEITLKNLWPGSWINANYGIWIGHPEDNNYWELLKKTRDFLIEYINNNPDKKHSQEIKDAWEEIYIAEGSDWCWWYGDQHSSVNDETFDFLFRKHLMNVYELLGKKIPDELFVAIKGKFGKKEEILEPVDFISPVIDGKITNYFEWLNAGKYLSGQKGTTMHQTETVVKELYFGYNDKNLYFRLDFNNIEYIKNNKLKFKIYFFKPQKTEINIILDEKLNIKNSYIDKDSQIHQFKDCSLIKILEFSVPFDILGIEQKQNFEFILIVNKILNNNEEVELERLPYQSTIKLVKITHDEFQLKVWCA